MAQNSTSPSAPANPHSMGRDKSDITGGWNWGAFFLGWIWALGNNVIIGLVSFFVPVFNIVLAVKGNEWAWNNKAWESVEEFKNNQRKWAIAGFISAAIWAGIITLLVLTPDTPPPPVVIRNQPTNTQLLKDNKARFTIAYPTDWQLVPQDETEILNSETKTESDKELKKYISTYLYEDPENLDATIYISARPHDYIDDATALDKVDDLEEDLATQNDNKDVKVTKQTIKVGQKSDIDAVLYEYEDAVEKGSTIKYHTLHLVTAANGNFYYAWGSTLRSDWETYKKAISDSVTSLNPMEEGVK